MSPVTMSRVALLAPDVVSRDLLVTIADEGTVALDDDHLEAGLAAVAGSAADRLAHLRLGGSTPALSPTPVDLDDCERAGRVDLIAGEAQLELRAAAAVRRGRVLVLLGWMPSDAVTRLASRLAPVGGAVVPLPRPAGVDPPTLLPARGPSHTFDPLVRTYATVPYPDVNPSVLAGLAYIMMFGIMFADVGHGAVLLLLAAAIRLHWSPRLVPLERAWPFLAGAGLMSMLFGALYGEFFGPTGVVPVLWLSPLDHPMPLLAAAVGTGAVLLAGSYALGCVNRFREGGWRRAPVRPLRSRRGRRLPGSRHPGRGYLLPPAAPTVAGTVMAAAGLVIAYVGFLFGAGGGGAGITQAAVELFDLVIRLGSNLVSFARLAAFGLTHAALGLVIWQATTALAGRGALGIIGSVVVFAIGNVVAIGLEGLVAGIQALRLEYYELFSRVFDAEGWPYRPWHIPTSLPEKPC